MNDGQQAVTSDQTKSLITPRLGHVLDWLVFSRQDRDGTRDFGPDRGTVKIDGEIIALKTNGTASESNPPTTSFAQPQHSAGFD